MPDMLRPPERDRLISYLDRQLALTVRLGGTEAVALRETTARLPTADWCWTAQTAAALEVLALPGLQPRWAGLAGRLGGFLAAMGETGVLLDRAAAPGCAVDSIDPRDFRVLTGTHEFTGDLSRGIVRQEALGRPGGREWHHTGHLVEFRLGRQNHCLDVEDSIARFGLVPQPDGVVLFHESELRVPAGLLKRLRPVGTLRYEYAIRAADPRMRLRVSLQAAPGTTLQEVRLTTAVDEMAGGGRPVGRIALRAEGRLRTLPLEVTGDQPANLHSGAADSLHVVEDGPPGQAAGLHVAFCSPERLRTVKLVAKHDRPHWLLCRYQAARLPAGAVLAVEEERLMTAGTLAGSEPAYAGLLAGPGRLDGRDPGFTADAGAALNAVALLLAQGVAPGGTDWRLWFDRHLAGFFSAMAGVEADAAPAPLLPARVALRPLCFALLALDVLPGPTPAQQAWQAAGLDALLAAQAEDGAFAEADGAVGLDGHAAALLALARLAARRPDARVSAALRRGLGALRLGAAEGGSQPQPLLRGAEDCHWSVRPALLMRAMAALGLAADAGGLTLDAAAEEARQTLLDACFRLLRGRIRSLDGDLEVLTAPNTTEGNAATQPVLLLAMLSPDEAALGRVDAGMAEQP
ncbi:hypothetical protein [Roseomonas haemaphysalidis]|uniref:Heparinase n=1 Tax=Roseomonas haemaphysalidis TaxID=2768162 RepID=A0ABS3KW65_9PROT|nr:hypothetical protein [Roseomonas haemaphysalidis]MBO1081122.1 hypothetical protein [Roseomonas haemaphysalidis]